MYFNPRDWPPSPGGFEPEQPPRKLSVAEERLAMRVAGVLFLLVFLSPFAGSSMIDTIVALVRAAAGGRH